MCSTNNKYYFPSLDLDEGAFSKKMTRKREDERLKEDKDNHEEEKKKSPLRAEEEEEEALRLTLAFLDEDEDHFDQGGGGLPFGQGGGGLPFGRHDDNLDVVSSSGLPPTTSKTTSLNLWTPSSSSSSILPPVPSTTTTTTSSSSSPWASYSCQDLQTQVDLLDETSISLRRNFAARAPPSVIWSGVFPSRRLRYPVYSPKIFVGGLPYDITEETLLSAFSPFGRVVVEWPPLPGNRKGFVYLRFQGDTHVKYLLQACSKSLQGQFFYTITSTISPRLKKTVEVRPWAVSQNSFVVHKNNTKIVDRKMAVFVGALHGSMSAEALATVMDNLFGGVVYAGIDVDRARYPIGSGYVAFNNPISYRKALSAHFVEIRTPRFRKTVQIDPYLLQEAVCSLCSVQAGPYFCRDWACFTYFCSFCYLTKHDNSGFLHHPPPLSRNAGTFNGVNLNPHPRYCNSSISGGSNNH